MGAGAIKNEWLLTLSGIVSVAFGVLLVFAPSAGERTAIYTLGAYALVIGVLSVALGLRLRSLYLRLGVGQPADSR